MYHYAHTPTNYHQQGVTQHTDLGREDVTLILRQQPKEALVTTDGKEKARKPVDPPPIVQIIVKPSADPSQVFLQSPYLFMCASLYKLDRNEAWDGNAAKSLAGCLTSSLHRLKDVDNKDAAFFVFGDISVKVHGTFRLHFSLFDLRKETNDVAYLGAITSDPFRVLLPKDFKGMDESTYLSRAFSDQGVRLRLRKEPRAMIGSKRSYPYRNESPSSNAPIRPNMSDFPSYVEEASSPNKRYRPSTEDRKDQFADSSSVSGAAFSSSYAASQYPDRMPSLGPNYSMPQYSAYENITTGTTAPYQFRPSSTSSYFPESIHQTSGTNTIPGTMSGPMLTQRYPNMQHQQQPYAHIFSYKQPRHNVPSASSFPGDPIGLNIYRMGPTAGLGDEPRPATSTSNPTTMAQQTPQSHHSARPTHSSIDPSRGVSYSQSPDLIRSAGFPSLGAQLPNPHRPEGRYDDQSQMTTSLYSPQRNYIQAPPTESSLTSHTDSGAIPPSLHFLPDLIQSTEEHIADSR